MKFFDLWHYGYLVLVRHKTRTLLLLLAVSLGVSSVLILTSLGEGAKLFITKEFSSLGNQMLIILPGKKETEGGAIPISAATERDGRYFDNAACRAPYCRRTPCLRDYSYRPSP